MEIILDIQKPGILCLSLNDFLYFNHDRILNEKRGKHWRTLNILANRPQVETPWVKSIVNMR